MKCTDTKRTINDFNIGDNVTYVPNHANNDISHPDCEYGQVTSKNDKYVFVKFSPQAVNGQACDPTNLFK